VLRYRSFRALTTIGFQAGISPFAESHCGALAIPRSLSKSTFLRLSASRIVKPCRATFSSVPKENFRRFLFQSVKIP
jgi:hypothetical protein